MYKRVLLICITTILLLSFVLTSSASQDEIRLIVMFNDVQTDVPPQIINGRVMVPVRAVAEAFNYDVKWDPDRRVVEVNDKRLGQLKRPDVVGPENFVNLINKSLDLVQEKDYAFYSFILLNTTKIVYDDKGTTKDPAAHRDYGITTTFFNGSRFDNYIASYSDSEKTLRILGTLTHESTHGYIFDSDLDCKLKGNDAEAVCELMGLRMVQAAGGKGTKVEAEYKQRVMNQLKL